MYDLHAKIIGKCDGICVLYWETCYIVYIIWKGNAKSFQHSFKYHFFIGLHRNESYTL